MSKSKTNDSLFIQERAMFDTGGCNVCGAARSAPTKGYDSKKMPKTGIGRKKTHKKNRLHNADGFPIKSVQAELLLL